MQVSVNKQSLDSLITALVGMNANVKKEVNTAINATGKKAKSIISAEVRKELAAKKKDVDETIKLGAKSNLQTLTTSIRLKKEVRPPLKAFGAKGSKRGGVSYKISKKEGRKQLPNAFIVASLGNHVFQRKRGEAKVIAKKGRYAGKLRQPIYKKYGASPWGVFVKNHLKDPVTKDIKEELLKQVNRRIRFLTLKAQGQLRGKQK